jgi:hypothetical protein
MYDTIGSAEIAEGFSNPYELVKTIDLSAIGPHTITFVARANGDQFAATIPRSTGNHRTTNFNI